MADTLGRQRVESFIYIYTLYIHHNVLLNEKFLKKHLDNQVIVCTLFTYITWATQV